MGSLVPVGRELLKKKVNLITVEVLKYFFQKPSKIIFLTCEFAEIKLSKAEKEHSY